MLSNVIGKLKFEKCKIELTEEIVYNLRSKVQTMPYNRF